MREKIKTPKPDAMAKGFTPPKYIMRAPPKLKKEFLRLCAVSSTEFSYNSLLQAAKDNKITWKERHDISHLISYANASLSEVYDFFSKTRKPDADAVLRRIANAKKLFSFSRLLINRGKEFKPAIKSAKNLASSLSTYPEARGAKIQTKLATAKINADTLWLSRLMLNLFDNARAAAGVNGEISVWLGTDKSHFIIRVADTGKGMTAGQKEKFSKGVSFTTDTNPGEHGLGLGVIRHAVALHNGTVEILDNKPKGTIFIVKIPLAK